MALLQQVRDFQAVIGKEVRQQCAEQFGGKPDVLLACVGGGSNAIGLFHEFVDDAEASIYTHVSAPGCILNVALIPRGRPNIVWSVHFGDITPGHPAGSTGTAVTRLPQP